jgi:hypothetical protein
MNTRTKSESPQEGYSATTPERYDRSARLAQASQSGIGSQPSRISHQGEA